MFKSQAIEARFSWPVGGRAVSEIGGRLIEDYVISVIGSTMNGLDSPDFNRVSAGVPISGRTLEDFSVLFGDSASELLLLVDIKGHNEFRKGSRPNLASIRKCLEIYDDPSKANVEIVIFFCRYKPNITPNDRGEVLKLEIAKESFSEKGVFLLRSLSSSNLDPANIGAGGQLLLAREDHIQIVDRTRAEFVELLRNFQQRLPGVSTLS